MRAFVDAQTRLSKHERDLLMQLDIDEESPGSVLRDIGTLIHLIESGVIEQATKGGLFPMTVLETINREMCLPVTLGLDRPQRKAYPDVNGLYLLLRGCGILRVMRNEAGQKLALDSPVLASWRSLNPTEQYFTLLETWLVHADPAVLGDSRFTGISLVDRLTIFLTRFPRHGVCRYANEQQKGSLGYWPGLVNVGLLRLFGLVDLRWGPVLPGRGLDIEGIRLTSIALPLLTVALRSLPQSMSEEAQPGLVKAPFGILQQVFQPFFPEWRNNLMVAATAPRRGAFIFKVTLGKAWRRIAAPARCTLEDLFHSIVDAFEFDTEHLYRFTCTDGRGARVRIDDPRACDSPPCADEVTIARLPVEPGDVIHLLYDFGDSWEFDIVLEEIDPADTRRRNPTLLERHGAAPLQYPESDEECEDAEDEWEEA